MSDAPTLTEVLEAALSGALDDVRVSLPGRIEAFDKTTRRATVQLLVMDGVPAEDGERTTVTLKPLTDVPVAAFGSRGVRIKFPVRKGDLCWVMFASSSIARCKETGRLVDPDDDRHHHLADAIAIPLVLGFGGPPQDGDGDGDEDAMIEFTEAGLIKAGGDEPLVKRSEFLGHTHATAGTGAPSPPVSGTAGSSVTFPGTGKLRG